MDYYELNFLTVGGVTLATGVSVLLPAARRSIYFHAEQPLPEVKHVESKESKESLWSKGRAAYRLLWRDFKDAYSNSYVVKWSIWWALATAGYLQGFTYIQVLWEIIFTENNPDTEESTGYYNGAVEAVSTILSAGAALGCGWLHLNWRLVGEATLALIAMLEGVVLLISAYTHSMWAAYVCYVSFGVLYYTMFTIVNAEVAKHINEDSYGLIFGINTFFALVLQSVLTAVVAAEGGLALTIRPQFIVYGSYFVVLGAVFAVIAAVTLCRGKHRGERLWLASEPATVPATVAEYQS